MTGLPDIDALAREACETSPGNPDFAWQLAQRQLTKALTERDDLDATARQDLRDALNARLKWHCERIAAEPPQHADSIKPVSEPHQNAVKPDPVTDQDVDHVIAEAFSAPFDGSEARLDVLEARARGLLDQLLEDRKTGFWERQSWRRTLRRKAREMRAEMMRDFPRG